MRSVERTFPNVLPPPCPFSHLLPIFFLPLFFFFPKAVTHELQLHQIHGEEPVLYDADSGLTSGVRVGFSPVPGWRLLSAFLPHCPGDCTASRLEQDPPVPLHVEGRLLKDGQNPQGTKRRGHQKRISTGLAAFSLKGRIKHTNKK